MSEKLHIPDPDNVLVYENIRQLVTMTGVAKKKGRHTTAEDLGIIEEGAIVVDGTTNTILWTGHTKDLPAECKATENLFSNNNDIWFPELVECHTHLVYAGSRHADFAKRAAGKTYAQCAAEGGGILFNLTHTREATVEELMHSAQAELEKFQKYGVGIIEAKSGYGLSLESELKVLGVLQYLQGHSSMVIVPTFMAAHAVPPEFKGRIDDYVGTIVNEWLPKVADGRWAEFFDVFIEDGYFNVEQARRMFLAAKEYGMKIKVHADQFKDIGGTELGLELGATSIDHLDQISEKNIQAFGKSDTVAVLLPGASLYTGTSYPPARKLIDAGARVAISTDFNPGTCPSRNLPLMTTLACSQMKMTVPESIAAITYNAAAALGLEEKVGTIEVGKQFRVCQLKAESYEVLPYCFGELD